MKILFRYDGPVLQFDKVVATKWNGETLAPTKEKAISNLQYQYKQRNGLLPTARVKLIEKYLTEVTYVM